MAKITKSKLNAFKGVKKQKISFRVDGELLDVNVFTGIDDTKIQDIIKEMLVINEFASSHDEYSILSEEAMAMMLLVKHLTDLPYENKESVEETIIELINVSTALNSKLTDNGVSIFNIVVNNIDIDIVNSITSAINKAIEIVNDKIGDVNA